MIKSMVLAVLLMLISVVMNIPNKDSFKMDLVGIILLSIAIGILIGCLLSTL
jgi:type III secretory pathway component EscT